MDIQVLNEIASLARQASLSKVSASVSANSQLKGLKGNPVPAPEKPATAPIEGSPEQTQAPVTPEISSVARAASAYSAVVGDDLNSDELSAIQDLAGKVRTAVSNFLSQPGLGQAENAATVVASNPEAVQELTATVERAVVATLNLPEVEGEVSVNATPPNADLLQEIPSPEKFISLERITHGAEFNNQAPVVASSPVPVNSPASENASVENPVTVEKGAATSSRDFTLTAASPALQNAQAGEHARAETSRPDAVNSPQQEPVRRPETVATNPQNTPVVAANPVSVNSRASENTSVENPVTVEKGAATSSRDFTLTAASPALQNAQAGEHARAETSRPDAVNSPQQEPVRRPETVAVNPQDTPVVAASPALQNAQAGEHARAETSRPDAVASTQQEPVRRPETVATNLQDTPVVAASPALQNAQAGEHARAETLVSGSGTAIPNNQQLSATTTSPELQNAQVQNVEVGNPVNIPVSSVDQGRGTEGSQAQLLGSEGAIAPPSGASGQAVSGQSGSLPVPNSQPASVPQPRPAQTSDLFAQDNAAVNPENIRNVNELVNSVVGNEFTSEAKKIFSEPKVIRTVADLADFILERLREIIANQQQQSQSSSEIGLS